MDIRKELFNLKDETYKKFQLKLLPNINNLIGVQIPKIRKLSKMVTFNKRIYYIENYECYYVEELILKGFFISELDMDIDTILNYVEKFVLEIDNWEVCDIFCSSFKIVKQNKDVIWDFILKYLYSSKEFQTRFALVIILTYYVSDIRYIDRIFSVLYTINCEYYYDKMSLAWLISKLYIYDKERVYLYLKSDVIDKELFKMSVRKIIDSNKVEEKDKNIIKKIKRDV